MNAPLSTAALATLQALTATEAGERTTLPLKCLIRSEYNVRDEPPKNVEELADSINAHGLMHNLTVYAQTKGKKRTPTGLYGVAAGDRRFHALLRNLERGLITEDFMVPVLIVSETRAIELSLAENVQREAMHPIAEFRAFQQLVEGGKTTEEVAAAFGVTPLVVQRRLKLVSVAPRFIDLCRQDEIKLDVLMALSLIDDHATQESLWDGLAEWERNASAIRNRLSAAKINPSSHPLARFVGMEDYEAAGGVVERDLFSESVFLTDRALLESLAQQKLLALGDEYLSKGANWLATHLTLDHTTNALYRRADMVKRDAVPDEQEALDALYAKHDELAEQVEAADNDEGSVDEVTYEQLTTALDDVLEQIERAEQALVSVSEAHRSLAGVVIGLRHNGSLSITENLLRIADLPEDNLTGGETREAGSATATSQPPKVKPMHTARLTQSLTAHRTMAMQAAMLTSPHVALVAATHALTLPLLYSYHCRNGEHPLKLHTNASKPHYRQEDVKDSAAFTAKEAALASWMERVPESDSALFAWLMTLPVDEVMALFALCVADGLDVIAQADAETPLADELCTALTLDVADWWAPTATTYLRHVARARILAVVGEVASPEVATRMAGLKKGDLVDVAEQVLAGKRWLPAQLQGGRVIAEQV